MVCIWFLYGCLFFPKVSPDRLFLQTSWVQPQLYPQTLPADFTFCFLFIKLRGLLVGCLPVHRMCLRQTSELC